MYNNFNNIPNNSSHFVSPSLKHDRQFKRFQNKIKLNEKKLNEKIFQKNSLQEGFVNFDKTNLEATNLTGESKNILNQTKPTSDKQLIQQYNQLLSTYQQQINLISNKMTKYLGRVDSNNPYLGTNIRFPDSGAIFYVTQQGVAKAYQSMNDLNATAGNNGCPGETWTELSIPWSPSYLNQGTVIPTTPELIVGTPMVPGQTCGNEGKNVLVNNVINNANSSYLGCYADNTSSPLMQFIGGSPPVNQELIINGNFSDPGISDNSFQFVAGYTAVTDWWFSAILFNNYQSTFTLPYPKGSQCAGILNNQGFSQDINLTSGSYTLTFYACNNLNNGSNYLNLQFNSNANATTDNSQAYIQSAYNNGSNILDNITPPNNWQKYTYTLNAPTSGVYTIGFLGMYFNNSAIVFNSFQINTFTNTWSNFDIIGIQGVSIISSNNNSSSGTFTYETCQEQAIINGYQNFALQDVNPTNNLGYCAVSNNLNQATSLGTSSIYHPTNLWASYTSDGVSATLNSLGSLLVTNSSGNASFQTPAAPMTNYVGCYQETCYSGKSGRAIPGINNGDGWNVKWDYNSCNEAAQQQGYQYFGLQYVQPNGLGQCTVTNDINDARQFGQANNCLPPDSDGVINGSWCSNSMYSTSNATNASFYWLVLQDDGNLCIYRGSGPGDIQGGSAIWCSMTNGKQQNPNPNFQASSGKTGVNWMPTGSILYPGEFIGSNDGSIYLTMQTDGNLTLNTSSPGTNCPKMSNGYYGGGVDANAIYKLSEIGDTSLLNNIYYVDQDSNAYLYPSQNISKSNNYTKFPNVNSGGNDLGPIYNSSVEECQQTCDNNNNCSGFVFAPAPNDNICFPKNNNMWPNSNDIQIMPANLGWSLDTYVKMNQLSSTPQGVETNTVNIDSVTAKNYVNPNINMASSYGLIEEISQQLSDLNNIENEIENLANQLSQNNTQIETSQNEVYKQTVKDKKAVEQFLKDYRIIEQKIKTIDSNTNILKDTDILVLQENYYYYLLTILAIGIVIIGINVLKK